MPFQEKYGIVKSYLTSPSKRRSGLPAEKIRFIVLHDTGNPGSSARGNVRYYENSRNQIEASAHLFVDDKEIIECIPALLQPPEKAWHVVKGVTLDNEMFGANANDAAIGIEYCYGGAISADEAYRRYVWLAAFICHKFSLDPAKSLVGHFFLDPTRKTDPVTGLAHSRRSYEQLLRDVVAEYYECLGTAPASQASDAPKPGNVRVVMPLNVRKGSPETKAPLVRTYPAGVVLPFVSWVDNGQSVNGNAKWFKDKNGDYFWSGATVAASG